MVTNDTTNGTSYKTLLKKLNAPIEYYEILGDFKKIKQHTSFDDIFNEKKVGIETARRVLTK